MNKENITDVLFDRDAVHIVTDTGKRLGLPLSLFRNFRGATDLQLKNYRVSAFGIHWDDLDEDVSFKSFYDYDCVPKTVQGQKPAR